jgi:hypothetical protein
MPPKYGADGYIPILASAVSRLEWADSPQERIKSLRPEAREPTSVQIEYCDAILQRSESSERFYPHGSV